MSEITKEEVQQYLTASGAIRPYISNEEKTIAFKYKAILLHGDRYSYDNTLYIVSRTRVTIECKEHGAFLQLPSEHLRGQGCPSCAKNSPLTQDEFIDRALKKHEGKYSYYNVKYINSTTKVSITCKEHGDFLQEANAHLRGDGCPSCANRKHNTIYLWKFSNSSLYKLGITNSSRLNTRIGEVAKEYNTTAIKMLVLHSSNAAQIEYSARTQLEKLFSRPLTEGAGYTEIFEIPDDKVSFVIDLIRDLAEG